MHKQVLTNGSSGLYPIRTLASMTGVNPVTLRAWERRYGLLSPMRTPKGHRLYDDADVDLVRQIVAMLESGIPISRAAALALSKADDLEGPTDDGAAVDDVWGAYQGRMRRALRTFNEDQLDAVYNEVLSLYPTDVATERLIVPLLGALGEDWREGPGGIAEEHFFSVYLRNKIGARFHHLGRGGAGPKLVTACVPEERHDTGLLLFGLSAAARGLRLVQLGASTPLVEVAVAVQRTGAVAAVLSASAERLAPALSQALGELIGAVDAVVCMGGQLSVAAAAELEALGVQPLGRDLLPALRKLESLLRTPPDAGPGAYVRNAPVKAGAAHLGLRDRS